MVATARMSGGWKSVGGQLICRDSGFVQHPARAAHANPCSTKRTNAHED